MQKFGYVFDSLPFDQQNAARVAQALKQAGATHSSVRQHSSGCVEAEVFLPSLTEFMQLEDVFIQAGLRRNSSEPPPEPANMKPAAKPRMADSEVIRFLKATLQGDTETVKALAAAGAPVDITMEVGGSRSRPLHFAAVGGHAGVVTALAAAGADKESRDDNGLTPLQVAANCGREAVVKALLAAGSDREAREAKGGLQAIHFAAIGGHRAAMAALLDAGADKDARDSCGATPLHYAAMGGSSAVVDMLLKAGADTTVQSEGATPLEFAEKGGHREIAELLRAKTDKPIAQPAPNTTELTAKPIPGPSVTSAPAQQPSDQSMGHSAGSITAASSKNPASPSPRQADAVHAEKAPSPPTKAPGNPWWRFWL